MRPAVLLLCSIAPSVLLADSRIDTCMRLSFDDYPHGGFYEYVVSRTTYLEMVEVFENRHERRPISETEAISIAIRAASSSPDEVRGLHHAKTVKPPGEVSFFVVDIRNSDYDGFVLIGPNGEVVERTYVEGPMTANPDCSQYRFDK